MKKLDETIIFRAVNSLFLKKKIELSLPSSAKLIMNDIPVQVSAGATLYEVYSMRNNEFYFFNPEGICSPGEFIIISKEEFNYLFQNRSIKLIKR